MLDLAHDDERPWFGLSGEPAVAPLVLSKCNMYGYVGSELGVQSQDGGLRGG